jgi:hypothetical protein
MKTNRFFAILWARLRSESPAFLKRVQNTAFVASSGLFAIGVTLGAIAEGRVRTELIIALHDWATYLAIASVVLAAFGFGTKAATSDPNIQKLN